MPYSLPPRLRQGDAVAVVATARVTDPVRVKAGIEILSSWGLKVLPGKSLFKQHHLFAGTDRQRADDLQQALNNPEVRAIFCARGGYGTTRLLDSLDMEGFEKSPKWICGFSDVTGLLCHVHSLGYACLHSSMPQLFSNENARVDYNSLRKALFDGEISIEANSFSENQPGKAMGVLVGGNLSLLVHLLGTKLEVNTEEKILVLEEVDEYLYHLDRMMVQLGRSGKLQHISGLVVGHLTKMKEGELEFGTDAKGVIKSHIHRDIPVAFGLPFGHESPNLTLPFGVECSLEVRSDGSRLYSKY
jgi:muramoyltetrapeptide carboxypeptidase